jgi:hypothetical protein
MADVKRQIIELDGLTGGSGPAKSAEEEIKKLRATHELWDENKPEWDFCLDAYQGGKDFAKADNIFKHFRENKEDYQDRVKRIHYINYCDQIVDFFTNFIFSEPIDRSSPDTEFFLKFTKDVNRKNEPVDTFMREVCDDMQILGMTYVLVDAPPLPEGQVLSKYDEQALNHKPYWVLIKPHEITDWDTDQFGKIVYAKRKQYQRQMLSGSVRRLEVYTEFFSDSYKVSVVDCTNKEKPEYLGSTELPNQLGEVPLVVARYKKDKRAPFIGLSFLRDFAYNNREIMNLTSLLQEFLYRQAFNMLTMQEGEDFSKAEGDNVIGTNNLLRYPTNAERPEYIYPPAEPAKFIQDERGKIKNEMFIRASQDAMNEMFNGEGKSGFSQAQSFSKTVPFISSRAEILEGVENELMRLTMKMVGKEWKGKIKYKDRYEITNLTDALTQLLIIVKDFQIPSETFVKEELKRIVREFDGKLPKETLAKIEKEIEAADHSKWMSIQKQALVGRGQSTTSPGDQHKPKQSGSMQEVAQEAQAQNVGSTKKKR